MAFDFSVEPEFEKKLEWIREFVREEVEPLEVLFPSCEFLPLNEERRRIVDPLKQKVRDQGLWAPHLGPELGGQGFGAVKLTLINEILGRATWSSIIFGTQAPDTGNAEIIARFGTQEQKDEYLTGSAVRGDLLHLLDDRAAGRLGPASVHHPRSARRGRLDHQRAQVLVVQRFGGHRSSSSWRSPTRTCRCTKAHRRSWSRRTPPG